MNKIKGRIIKIVSSLLIVQDKDGNKCEVRLSGNVRRKHKIVLGDFVLYHKQDDCFIVDEVLARNSYLLRPNVANVDQALIVMSIKEPDFDEILVNRMIIQIELNNIEPLILLTKYDLDDGNASDIVDRYKLLGYKVFVQDNFNEINHELISVIRNKVTVLAGQSGVGKTTLINRFLPHENLKTQGISKALNRGKHTTTHFELFEFEGGLIADTPGFSSLEFNGLIDDLLNKLSVFKNIDGHCKYSDCRHINEPDCRVKEYFEKNPKIKSFYNVYIDILLKKQETKKW